MEFNPIAKIKRISKLLSNKKQRNKKPVKNNVQKEKPIKNTVQKEKPIPVNTIEQKTSKKKFTLKIQEDSEEEKELEEITEQNNIVEEKMIEEPMDNQQPVEYNRRAVLHSKVSKMRRVICLPDSILLKVQTQELQNCLIGQLARIFCLYKINEIIIIHDHSYNKTILGVTPALLIQKVLQYLETPQYLRKRLFPISPELKFVGLIAPLECHHHLRVDEPAEFREGVVLKRPIKDKNGSWVDIGLYRVG